MEKNKTIDLPKKYSGPQIIALASASNGTPDSSAEGARGGGCSWK